MDELDLTSAESKATYEEIKTYVLEHGDPQIHLNTVMVYKSLDEQM